MQEQCLDVHVVRGHKLSTAIYVGTELWIMICVGIKMGLIIWLVLSNKLGEENPWKIPKPFRGAKGTSLKEDLRSVHTLACPIVI